jgi:hypothetical protein
MNPTTYGLDVAKRVFQLYWVPNSESASSTVVCFASDPGTALQMAMSMRPQSRITVCVTEHEHSGLDWWSSVACSCAELYKRPRQR